MEYILSDLHFCHKNILNFEPPRAHFQDVDQMNDTIVEHWNKTVTNEDTVHFVGDFGIGSPAKVVEQINRLNGKILLYPGNHDTTKIIKKIETDCPRVTIMPLMVKFKFSAMVAFISHYPVEIGVRPNLFSIHGHIHSNPSSMITQLNICADNHAAWGTQFGEPIPFDRIKERMFEIREQIETTQKDERRNQPS